MASWPLSNKVVAFRSRLCGVSEQNSSSIIDNYVNVDCFYSCSLKIWATKAL